MSDKFVTEMDRWGREQALADTMGKKFGLRREHVQPRRPMTLESVEDLLARDKQREKDGFPRKIRFRRMLVSADKVIVVPYATEEKLVHWMSEPPNLAALSQVTIPDIDETTGHGDGNVGDVIGHTPIGGDGDGEDGSGDGEGNEPGKGAGGSGEERFEEEAYETGKQITEKFQLPNIKEKAKKVPTSEYTYDLTDRRRGAGQVLDKKATLRQVIETNLQLGTIDEDNLEPSEMLVAPGDMVYRVLSQERVWRSQAVVFFVRDWSGSMWGEPTRALVAQHLLIYAWLLVQFEKRVIPRFICHDGEAQEVIAKHYFTAGRWGGTLIASAYKEINKIVEGESLERDYNIYMFQGTDGDDGDFEGEQAVPELRRILTYASRVGVTLFKHPYWIAVNEKTEFERYIEKSKILEQRDVFRMHTMPDYRRVTDEQNIEALKKLIAQD